MKKIIVKIIKFLKGKSFARNVIVSIILLFTFLLIGFLLHQWFSNDINVTAEILVTAFGFSSAHVLYYITASLSRGFEDKLKVNTDTKDMLNIYKEPSYHKIIELNGSKADICYHEVIVDNNYQYVVEDNPTNVLKLDNFFDSYGSILFDAHTSSKIQNFLTIRLDDVIKNSECNINLFYQDRHIIII